jgi:hypothetical protein
MRPRVNATILDARSVFADALQEFATKRRFVVRKCAMLPYVS